MDAKGLFGFAVSITYNSISITYNLKYVGPTKKKKKKLCLDLFPVFVSITQLSNFWVISYGNVFPLFSAFKKNFLFLRLKNLFGKPKWTKNKNCFQNSICEWNWKHAKGCFQFLVFKSQWIHVFDLMNMSHLMS